MAPEAATLRCSTSLMGLKDKNKGFFRPQVDNSFSQVAAGTSSFGMSGVNAHALFSAPDLVPGDPSDESSKFPALTWCAERHWVGPAAHRLLRSFSWGAAGGTCSFSVDLSAPNLAYLLDHQVN